MNRIRQLMATLAVVGVIAASNSQAVVYSFQQGVDAYNGQTDTFVDYQGDWTINNGGITALTIFNSGNTDYNPGTGIITNPDYWQKMGLVRFSLGSVPSFYQVASAQLTLTVVLGTDGSTYSLHRILRPGLDFGSSNGAAEIGAVSVGYSSYASTGWGAGDTNANPRASVDYAVDAFASDTLSGAATTLTFDVTDQVRSWVNHPTGNLGFVILNDTVGPGQSFIYSAEFGTVGSRPFLTLEAFQVPEPSTVLLLATGGLLFWYRRRK